MTPLVSIIIPAYNAQAFVGASVKSALGQSYGNVQVIAVNDGSKDNTLAILQQLAATDSRLTVIDQPNGGVTAARMAGISMAAGEWICFLDADDMLPPDAIGQYAQLFETGAHIIISGFDGELSKEDYLSRLLRLSTVRPELWGKCFKASLVREHMPRLDRTVVMGEDLLQNLVLGLDAQRLVTIPALLYDINMSNTGSVTKTFKHTEQYETSFFELLDTIFLDRCLELPDYGMIEESAFWSKLNGLKQVVLDGNRFDVHGALWQSVSCYYRRNTAALHRLGPSEKLLLKMSGHQQAYRTLIHLYLRH